MLNHRVTGSQQAPVLLLGSSLGTHLDVWEPQLSLATNLRLIRYDHRGHGATPPSPGPYEIEDLGCDVLNLMDSLGVERASYCGTSLGGMVGMWLAANRPARIERLVLLCTSAHLPPASMWRERARTVRESNSLEPIADAVIDRWLTRGFAETHADVRQSLRAMLCDTDPRGYAACCGAIERMDLRPQLRHIAAPVLIISASEDSAAPPPHQQLIADAIERSRYEVVSPAAHLAAVERPDEVNELILEALT